METKIVWRALAGMMLAIFLSACGDSGESNTEPPTLLERIQQQRVGDYEVVLLSDSEQLTQGANTLILQFRNPPRDTLVAVDNLRITATMPMPGAADMTTETTIDSPATPGYYSVNTNFPMAGKWIMTVQFNENQQARFELMVR